MKKRIKRIKDTILVKKPLAIIFLVIFFLLLIFVLGNLLGAIFEILYVKIPTCGDGSFYNTCSLNRPYFCENGRLIERALVCGCSFGFKKDGDSCISEYNINSKNISLPYTLKGEIKNIDLVVYEGSADYLSDIPRTIYYSGGERASRVDFKLKNINEEMQREFLMPLVVEIQNLADKKEDQARIAVSLVQNIPFGESDKPALTFSNYSINYSRYPYEVLYDGYGICGEKSELLAFLLKEIGYGVVIFYYEVENHEAVGIKCPVRYALENTDYCFVETSGPAIISDNEIEYDGGLKLTSQPEIMLISDGISLGNIEEYKDAEEFKKIRKSLRDGKLSSDEADKLEELKEKYGLVEIYKI